MGLNGENKIKPRFGICPPAVRGQALILTTRAEVTSGLALQAEAATTYAKTEVTALLLPKANADDVYSKVALNPILDNEVDDADFFIATGQKADKTYVNTQLATKAPHGYVDQKVTDSIALVANSAPQALDTPKELAQALNNDSDYATFVQTPSSNNADKSTTYTKLAVD